MSQVLRFICLLCWSTLSAGIFANAQNINTIAGGIGDGGLATNTVIGSPAVVWMDRSDNIYIVDYTHTTIRKVSPTGIVTHVAGTPNSTGYSGDRGLAIYAQLDRPTGIVTDTSGNLYIADAGNQRIRKIDRQGVITTFVTLSRYINAITIDDNQFIYVATNDQRISKITPTGYVSVIANSAGYYGFTGDGGYAIDASFRSIASMCTDHLGNIYLLDATNNNIRKIYPSGIITTFAGDGVAGYYGDGISATSARFSAPTGISADNSGNIYVADKNNNVLRKISSSGIINTIAGIPVSAGNTGDGGLATAAKLSAPSHAIADASGNIYIADYSNNRVRKIDPSGIISSFTGTTVTARVEHLGDGGPAKSAILNQPIGIFIDTSRNTFVTEYGLNGVRKINASGIITRIAGNDTAGFSGDGGPATNAKFNKPSGVVKDSRGNIYICDMVNRRIRKVAPSGIVTTYAGGGLRPPVDGAMVDTVLLPSLNALAIDKYDNIYVSTGNRQIKKIDTNKIIKNICGTGTYGYSGDGGPATSAQIGDVLGLVVYDNKRIFLADYGANRVRVIDSAGIITTYAGIGTSTVSGDGGSAVMAGVPYPNGVTLDKFGNLFISSNGNIRKVTPAGIITKYGGLSGGTLADDQPAIVAAISNGGGNSVGMQTDTLGNLLFTDGNQNKIRVIYNAGISISTPIITYCTPTSATFTATATAAPGIAVRYRWYLNGYPVGVDSFRFTAPLLHDSDIVYCNITNGASTTILATSNKINIKVHPFRLVATVGVNYTPSTSAVCIGTTVNCTPTAVNGGTSPNYFWYKNDTLISTGTSYRFVPNNNDTVFCKMISNEYCLVADTVVSARRAFVVNNRTNPYAYIDTRLDSTPCPGATVSATLLLGSGGGVVTYSWYRNNIFVDNSNNYRFVPNNNDSIYCAVRIANGCLNYDTAISPVRHIRFKKPIVYITSSNGTAICPGLSTSMLASNLEGGITPIYHWYKNGTLVYTGNPYLAHPNIGDSIYCRILSSVPCILNDSAKSNTIYFTTPIYLNPKVVVNATKGTRLCEGTSAYFIASSANGGTAPIYRWYVNDVDTVRMVGATFSYTPVNGDIVRCIVTSNATCLARDTAWSIPDTMSTIIPDTASIVITSDIGTQFCYGKTALCTQTSVNAGGAPKYAWYLNNSKVSTSATYSRMPNNGDEIYCTLTNDLGCLVANTVTSNILKYSIANKVTPAVTITSDQGNKLCGATEVTCTAEGVNTGDAPEYKWYLNNDEVGNGITYTFTPNNSDYILCKLISNFDCITTNTVVSANKYYYVYEPPTVTLSSDIGPVVYRGTTVSLKAQVNGGGIDNYETSWYINGNLVATNKSNTYSSKNFNDWDSVYCIVNYTGVCEGSIQSNTLLINTYHNLKLYPNPSNGEFTISVNDFSVNGVPVELEVYDMMGQRVYAEKTNFDVITLYHKLNLSNELPSGVYMLKVTYEKTKLSRVFVVKH